MRRKAINLVAIFALTLAVASVAPAQAVLVARTYVSSTGNDANACSLAAPCRNFSAAAGKTMARGEITALDTATYGNLTISKALTIQAAPGVHAVMGTLSSTIPIAITAGESDVVVLRNLHVTRAGLTGAPRGIQFSSGGALHIENCVVAGFSYAGIYFVVPSVNPDGKGPRLFVKDTIVRDNGVGLMMSSVFASIDRSRIENNVTGVDAENQSVSTFRDTVIAGNSDYGFIGNYGSSTKIENCVVTGNGTGIAAIGFSNSPAFYVSHTMIVQNNMGLVLNGGSIYSFGNNRLASNSTTGTFTSTIQEQ